MALPEEGKDGGVETGCVGARGAPSGGGVKYTGPGRSLRGGEGAEHTIRGGVFPEEEGANKGGRGEGAIRGGAHHGGEEIQSQEIRGSQFGFV